MSRRTPDPECGSQSSIRQLFSEYVARLQAGEDLEPQESERLVDAFASTVSLRRRIESRYGAGADPEVSLLGSADEERDESAGRAAAGAPHSIRYRNRGEVARGGMGVILRVWDSEIRRNLAMKVLKGGGVEPDNETVGRFLEEAQITGQLEHPGIVPVHEVGIDPEGRLYFTMRLVRGQDLREVFDRVHRGRGEWTLTRALGVLLKACEAIAYAHSKGVIHRDLKPSNIMVGRFGQVYVMDWGLAKLMRRAAPEPQRPARPLESTSHVRLGPEVGEAGDAGRTESTMAGTILGTPAYMSPEQALGRLDKVGRYSDVYAVGAILYHLLTGQLPYVASGTRPTSAEIIARVCKGRPRRIQRLAPDLPPELVAICEKAMARHPRERYPIMGHMARDLRAYLEGRVVRAHKTGAVVEFRKWVMRNRGTAAAILVAILSAFGGLSTVSVVLARSKQALESSNVELGDAVEEALRAQADLEQQQQRLREANDALSAERGRADEAAARARLEADTAEEVLDFMRDLFQASDPTAALHSDVTATEILRSAKERILGGALPDPRVRVRVLFQLARAFHSLDEYDEAEPLVNEALEIERGIGGDEVPKLLDHLVNQARIVTERGALPAEAEYLWTLLIEEYAAREGDQHSRTLACRAGRASVYVQHGGFEQARTVLEDVLRIVDASRFEKLAWTVQARLDLARAYEELGQVEHARETYRKAIVKADDLSGNDRTVLHVKSTLAAYCARTEDLARAEPLYREVLRGWLEVYGGYERATYERALACGASLIDVLGRRGRPDQAEEVYRDLYETCRDGSGLGPSHPKTLNALTRLVATRIDQQKIDARTVELAKRLVRLTPEEAPEYEARANLLDAALGESKGD